MCRPRSEFYTKLFGWTTQQLEEEFGSYVLVKVGENEVGGVMATPPEAQGMPPMWGVYVTVDDVDATAKMAGRAWRKNIGSAKRHSERGAFLRNSGSSGGSDLSDHNQVGYVGRTWCPRRAATQRLSQKCGSSRDRDTKVARVLVPNPVCRGTGNQKTLVCISLPSPQPSPRGRGSHSRVAIRVTSPFGRGSG